MSASEDPRAGVNGLSQLVLVTGNNATDVTYLVHPGEVIVTVMSAKQPSLADVKGLTQIPLALDRNAPDATYLTRTREVTVTV